MCAASGEKASRKSKASKKMKKEIGSDRRELSQRNSTGLRRQGEMIRTLALLIITWPPIANGGRQLARRALGVVVSLSQLGRHTTYAHRIQRKAPFVTRKSIL